MNNMRLLLLGLCFTFIASQELSPYKEVKKFVRTFKPRGMNANTYFLLSIDEKHNNLLVGTRDIVFLVKLNDTHMESYESWILRQKPEKDTFLELMLPYEDKILLCWVERPFTRKCTWRNRTTLGEVPTTDQGYVFKSKEKYNAPSSPTEQNDTAIITEDGTLFFGTSLPVQAFARSGICSKRLKQPNLKEVCSDRKSSFNEDVHFVKSFEIGTYVYFFFHERSLECHNCGKVKTSRVARVCTGDVGYLKIESSFVTFQKAKLICSDGMKYALNFNEIQDVWWDNRTDRFYAAFTAQPNAPAISAICIYELSSINQIFDNSPIRSFASETGGWTKKKNNLEYFAGCKVNPKFLKGSSSVADGVMATRDMQLSAYEKLTHDPLMADGVEPVGSKAWIMSDGIRMTGISLDVVGRNIVVYASTDRGSVVKISQPPEISQPCLYSEMEIYPSNKREVIKTMAIDQDRHVLYVGTHYSLTQLSLDQCERYQYDKRACISAADPYCGWDNETFRCSSVLSHGERLQQNLTICPKGRKENSWSSWGTCVQSDGNLCRCQTRRCQDKGNTPCLPDVRLENCTVDLSVGWEGERSWEILGVQHGNWSAWGNWSECSTETWAGLRNRSRTCTNPVPRRGGRTCVGDSIQYEPCRQEDQGVSGRPQGNHSGCTVPVILAAVGTAVVFGLLVAVYCCYHKTHAHNGFAAVVNFSHDAGSKNNGFELQQVT
ncbi:PREDICTED: semaphorin-5A-like isoform X6 [Acropora digitifera]|uniref:semaphorin-5A-like isoform X6 n=1 Tax=Acropora digitifera TaxID=70779 RepID=UPI00077B190D|nr:PREDICTED: semaphorin-5A-like isoform X6 [Acropora digitifera]